MSAFRLIAAEKANHPISVLCEMLGVSRSGFHAWERRPPSDRELADAWLLEQIKRRSTSRTGGSMERRVSMLSCGWLVVCGSGASASSG